MNIVKIKDGKSIENPHGVDAKKIFDGENSQVIYINLNPGESLIKHITPVDVFFFVIEGVGKVIIGDEEEMVSKDSFIDSPANIPHAWENNGRELLRILVVKTPNPMF